MIVEEKRPELELRRQVVRRGGLLERTPAELLDQLELLASADPDARERTLEAAQRRLRRVQLATDPRLRHAEDDELVTVYLDERVRVRLDAETGPAESAAGPPPAAAASAIRVPEPPPMLAHSSSRACAAPG